MRRYRFPRWNLQIHFRVYFTASGRDTLGFGYMVLTIIIVWLALQIPLGALIGTFFERGMAQPRRREEKARHVAVSAPGPLAPPIPAISS